MNRIKKIGIAFSLTCGMGLLATQTATAEIYSCERYSTEPSGFGSVSVFNSWFPNIVILNTNKAKKDGNQFVFEKPMQFGRAGLDYVKHRTRLLPNGTAVAGISTVGGYQQTGKARYKCKNWSK